MCLTKCTFWGFFSMRTRRHCHHRHMYSPVHFQRIFCAYRRWNWAITGFNRHVTDWCENYDISRTAVNHHNDTVHRAVSLLQLSFSNINAMITLRLFQYLYSFIIISCNSLIFNGSRVRQSIYTYLLKWQFSCLCVTWRLFWQYAA